MTVKDIKKLRERTGLSIAMCNSAFQSAMGNYDKALEILSEKANLKSDALADRTTTAKFIGFYRHHDGTRAALVTVECETDFVARSETLRNLADDIACHVAGFKPENVEELKTQPLLGDGKLVSDLIKELSAKTGEKIEIGCIILV